MNLIMYSRHELINHINMFVASIYTREWACICDNSDEIGEGGREESDLHNPGKGTDTKTNIRTSGQENSTIDENISCACVIDEECKKMKGVKCNLTKRHKVWECEEEDECILNMNFH